METNSGLDWLPEHKCSLQLTHNECRDYYMTVREWLDDGGPNDDEWVSVGEMQKAIDENNVWCLQWYPRTPVSFHIVFASSIEAIMAWLKEVDDD